MQKIYFHIVVILLLSTACSDFRKLQKSSDWQVKYDAAMEYYQDKDYYRAIVLLESVLPIIRGTKTAEDAQYYYAYAHYYDRKYILSAHYFKNFYDTYTRSKYAIEALYMHAYSLYLQSPIPSLDQGSTMEAIEAMQLFINRYPYSEYKDQAEQILDELQQKLEVKAYKSALLYYKLGRYDAAIIAFNNFQKDYPDSKLNEDISYWKVAAQFQLAEESISSKQKERYFTTIEYYQSFIDKYPNSKFIKDAEKLYENSVGKIKEDSNNKAS